MLAVDISKAFDSVHHSLTLAKLNAYGFSDRSLDLMRSFFYGRLNRVKVSTAKSDWKEMKRGCLQGSSLGPLPWNLYQKDLSYQVSNANLNMYADDHRLYTMGSNAFCMKARLESEAAKALTWYNDNYLMVNPDKFQLLMINSQNDKDQASLTINAHVIESTADISLLGVNIDEHLVFSKHIGELCIKAGQRVGVLSRLGNLIPTEAKLLLYKSSILPHLTYCHLIWHFCKASDARKVERVQERALRIVYNTHSVEYSNLLNRANLPSLQNRRLQDLATLMYKVKYGLVPRNVVDIFSVKSSKYHLRNMDFHLPRFISVRYGKHSIRYFFGPSIWSRLDSKIKNKPSLQSFKSSIRRINLVDLITENCGSSLICRT